MQAGAGLEHRPGLHADGCPVVMGSCTHRSCFPAWKGFSQLQERPTGVAVLVLSPVGDFLRENDSCPHHHFPSWLQRQEREEQEGMWSLEQETMGKCSSLLSREHLMSGLHTFSCTLPLPPQDQAAYTGSRFGPWSVPQQSHNKQEALLIS